MSRILLLFLYHIGWMPKIDQAENYQLSLSYHVILKNNLFILSFSSSLSGSRCLTKLITLSKDWDGKMSRYFPRLNQYLIGSSEQMKQTIARNGSFCKRVWWIFLLVMWGSYFYLHWYDERSRDYQSCCCDIFLTFSFLGRFLKVNKDRILTFWA